MAPKDVTLVDLPALRAALDTIDRHFELLAHAAADFEPGPTDSPIATAREAMRRVVEDDFRSDETRGGS
jgi:hypothetical protein